MKRELDETEVAMEESDGERERIERLLIREEQQNEISV